MLVLSRKKNESVVINDDTRVTIVDIRDDKVRLGIVAPKEVPVYLQDETHNQNRKIDADANEREEILRLQKELAAAQNQIKQYRQLLQHYLQEEWRGISSTDLEQALNNDSAIQDILRELEQGTHA